VNASIWLTCNLATRLISAMNAPMLANSHMTATTAPRKGTPSTLSRSTHAIAEIEYR
jgi:hypothetical protein